MLSGRSAWRRSRNDGLRARTLALGRPRPLGGVPNVIRGCCDGERESSRSRGNVLSILLLCAAWLNNVVICGTHYCVRVGRNRSVYFQAAAPPSFHSDML